MSSTSPSSPLLPGASTTVAQLLDDAARDRYARLARAQLGATVSVVSLTADDGRPQAPVTHLPAGWASAVAPHLGDTVRALVVARDVPVVSRDVQHDPALRDLLAGPDALVGAVVGYPLRDTGSSPAGALCVMDTEPRDWTDAELQLVEDLAEVCSSDLRLRGEHARSREIQRLMTQTNRQSRLLLLLSDAFADAMTIDDVAQIAGRVATTGLGARYTGLALLSPDGTTLRYTSLDGFYAEVGEEWRTAHIDDDRPLSAVARTRKPMMFPDGDHMAREFPATATVVKSVPGARVMLPLVSSGKLLGALSLIWDMPRDFDEQSAAIKTALAGYTAQALDRARMLAERQGVARTLQAAMLSPLPTVHGVTLASIYEPAARTEEVGGDWYDAIELPDRSLAVMIGDVTGHDVAAAAVMGQLRSMLRAFAWEHNEPPSAILSILDKTNSGVRLDATGTAIVARLSEEDDGLRMRWSSAGHPPPVVLRADRSVEILQGRNDLMLGVEPSIGRHDHETHLAPGDVLVLYTDGLVERRGEMLRDGLGRLVATLEGSGDEDLADLPAALVRDLVGEGVADDVAVLLVRVDEPSLR
ncbi:SpoIIE family protein phosphatase [Sanguibacter sp. 25GB23B1]|uniref:GAF domain-containing SpoIIE family protein phosphatase n=1 Tax=unclassified Sanguibacter TaxID=2645534 RepID=UPI0032B00ED5